MLCWVVALFRLVLLTSVLVLRQAYVLGNHAKRAIKGGNQEEEEGEGEGEAEAA